MTLNEKALAQLRVEVSSDGGESSLSGNEEDISSDLGEYLPARSKQPTQRRDDTSYDASSSSSSDGARKLSRLERQRQYSPSSEGSNEMRLSQIQSQNAGAPGYASRRAPGTVERAIGSGEAAGSESDIGSQMGIGPGKHTSRNLSPEFPTSVAMQIESDGYSYDSAGLRHQRELCNPATSYPTAGDAELQNSEARPPSRNSLSSDDEIPRPRGLQQGQPVGEISSDGEGMDDNAQIQSIADQEVDSRPCSAGSFDYRSKLSPLSTQQLRSFVFHDLTVTHHIPRIAIQGFSSLHTSERPSDPRTTKRLMGVLTGLEEIRYDCCTAGCISYSLPRYSSLEECPINGCKHARYKADGNPYAQHTYIPITHRLQLMYSDKERAIEMMTYRAKMDEEMETEVCSTLVHNVYN